MLKYTIEISPLGTRYVVAAKDPGKGTVEQVFTLNETAANMLRLFSEGLDAEAVAGHIASDYEAPVDIVRRDVDAFWKIIASKGLTV